MVVVCYFIFVGGGGEWVVVVGFKEIQWLNDGRPLETTRNMPRIY